VDSEAASISLGEARLGAKYYQQERCIEMNCASTTAMLANGSNQQFLVSMLWCEIGVTRYRAKCVRRGQYIIVQVRGNQ
jgi:hypothetical protein